LASAAVSGFHSRNRASSFSTKASTMVSCLVPSVAPSALKEAAELEIAHLLRREDHWAIVDLVGKGRCSNCARSGLGQERHRFLACVGIGKLRSPTLCSGLLRK